VEGALAAMTWVSKSQNYNKRMAKELDDEITQLQEQNRALQATNTKLTLRVRELVDGIDKLQKQAHKGECFQCLPLWEGVRHFIGVPHKCKVKGCGIAMAEAKEGVMFDIRTPEDAWVVGCVAVLVPVLFIIILALLERWG